MLESSLVYTITRTLPESLVLVLSGLILLGIGIDIDKSKVIKRYVIGIYHRNNKIIANKFWSTFYIINGSLGSDTF